MIAHSTTDPGELLRQLTGGEFSEKPESLEPITGTAMFPLDALPPLLADVVEPAAATFGLPAAFYTLPLLGTVAAALGNGAEVELRPGQRERPILWLACIGRPGSGKSPAFDLARRPLDQLQETLWRAWQDQRDGWEALPKEQRPAARPVLESVIASDTTIEALGALLPSTRGLLVARDELSGWASGMDQYRKRAGSDRSAWLALWSGAPLRIDRKSNDEPIYVPRPCVSIAGNVQPDILPALRGEAALDDGLLDRLLVAWPVARAPRWSETTFPDALLDRVADALNTLRRHVPVGDGPATIVRLSPEAKRSFVAWHDDNAERIETGAGLGAGFAAKLSRHVPRLALVLHAAAGPDALARPLEVDTLDAAIE